MMFDVFDLAPCCGRKIRGFKSDNSDVYMLGYFLAFLSMFLVCMWYYLLSTLSSPGNLSDTHILGHFSYYGLSDSMYLPFEAIVKMALFV